MNFSLTDEQHLLRKSVREFAETEIRPHVMTWDESQHFPKELLPKLADLGLMAELDAAGIRTRELIYANRLGQVVWQELRGIDAGYEVPQISIHRGRLLGVIHRVALNRLGADAIHTGCKLAGFADRGDRVAVRIEPSGGAAYDVECDLLVGADGIHSAVRGQLYPGEGAPIWSGVMLW